MAALSPSGELCIFTVAGADLLLDVTGYVPEGVDPITPLTPARLHDSRPGYPLVDGASSEPRLAANQVVEVQVTGRAGVPTSATAAFLDVIAVAPDGPGYLTLFPCTDEMTHTSNVNYVEAGTVIANGATTLLSERGTVCVFTPAATDLVVGITGYVD